MTVIFPTDTTELWCITKKSPLNLAIKQTGYWGKKKQNFFFKIEHFNVRPILLIIFSINIIHAVIGIMVKNRSLELIHLQD